MILIILFTIIGGISEFYKKYVPFSLGFELKTFFTIIIAYAINPIVAFISSLCMIILAAFVSQRFHYWVIYKIVIYALICVLVESLKPIGFVFTGIIAVLFLNGCYFFLTIIQDKTKALADFMGLVLNILFNFFLIKHFGEFFIRLII